MDDKLKQWERVTIGDVIEIEFDSIVEGRVTQIWWEKDEPAEDGKFVRAVVDIDFTNFVGETD